MTRNVGEPKEAWLARRRAWWASHRERLNAQKRAERAADPEGVRAIERAQRAKDRAKVRERERRWHELNPEKSSEYDARRRLRRHGISPADYEEILVRQRSRCALCEADLAAIPRSKVTIDHCHRTGRVRGVLCSSCNLFIGHAKENVSALQRAIDYLKEFTPCE